MLGFSGWAGAVFLMGSEKLKSEYKRARLQLYFSGNENLIIVYINGSKGAFYPLYKGALSC